MSCLSEEQLARLALGLTEDAIQTAHLKECASCRVRSETMQSLVSQMRAAHAKFDSTHEEARERLMAILPENRPLETARTRIRFLHWVRELSMKKLMALGGVGVAAIVAILLFWLGSAATPLSAMEKMTENVRKAKSYKCTVIMKQEDLSEPEKPSNLEMIFTVYWIAPDSARTEVVKVSPKTFAGPGSDFTQIRPAGKPGIMIFHQVKKYTRYPTRKTNVYSSTSDKLENLGSFLGKADQSLGTKEIGGKKAEGFKIDMKKMGSVSRGGGMAEIWIDVKSNLPLLVRYELFRPLGRSSSTLYTDIQWNIDLEEKLFDATPPEGYTDDTLKPPTLEEQALKITEALRIYAEASGGIYPGKTIYDSTGITEDLCKMLGLAKFPAGEKEGNAGKAQKAYRGFDQISKIDYYNQDFAYFGTSVKSGDKEKVLLRWKLDDGQYEVIFGDLRAETVTAEKLHELEGK
jgi:outer membrane lipoprotein-sorting protein